MLTAYDYTTAMLIDGAGVDAILVGDSASNVMAGNLTTLPITLDQMIYHAKSVVRGVKRALVVVDMPFGTYQVNADEAVKNAIRIMKESHADALKLEGGEEILPSVRKILDAGIPIMGHLGLTSQSINKFGTYSVRAKNEEEAEKLRRDALLLQEAGCFAIVLEKFPPRLVPRSQRALNSCHRYWCGWRCRWSGARLCRHAWHDCRLYSAFLASLRRPSLCYHRRCGQLRG